MGIVNRIVGGLIRATVTLLGIIVIAFIVAWGVQTFGGIDVFGEAKRAWNAITDGSWKRAAGSVLGVLFLVWLLYDALMGPTYYGGVNSNQANNYRNGRGFIDLDGNGRDDRFQR